MVPSSYPSGGRVRRRNRRSLFSTALLVAISMSPVAYFVDFERRNEAPPTDFPREVAHRAPAPEASKTATIFDPVLVDPTPTLKPEALAFARNAPLQAAFRSSVPQEFRIDLSAPEFAHKPTPPAPPVELAEAVQPAPLPVPLPVPRPAEFRFAKSEAAQQIARAPAAVTPRPGASQVASAPVDSRNFIEKLFGIRPAAPPEAALSYAALGNGTGSIAPTSRFGTVPDGLNAGTAVYDIVAQTVTLPNGEKLEAHSGLGDKMDDPRYVNVRMKGATPPGTYIVTEREALFHGVRALRLTPVGGSAAIYGRDGILAHTYMLGPRGDSNGCVSFKNYDRFLQAYLRGEVKRLIVTAGRGQDLLPRMVNQAPRRSARAI
jgi:hypothetical protein